ncbi:MAG: bifunctional phosphoglucose/phosphomannose isomerase [candidate division WOR-3 bacterium]
MECDGRRQMFELVWSLPEQLGAAVAAVGRVRLGRVRRFDSVVVAGMGGSAMGGDICRCLLLDESPVPVLVWRDYRIPKLVTGRTLFLAVSYSGGTEETLAAFEEARERGAWIVCVTSGGVLGSLAVKYGCPVVPVPAGMPPRAALGHLFGSLITVLHRLGACRSFEADIAEAVRLMRSRRRGWHQEAAKIARRLKGRLPLVYSTSRLLDCVADRWRCQLNENAKVLCHTNVLPELDHNEIVGAGRPGFLAARSALVALLDRNTHPRNRQRLAETVKVVGKGFGRIVEVKSEGRSALARVFSLVMLGDLVSVELARLNDVDPLPIARIDALKQRMARGRQR